MSASIIYAGSSRESAAPPPSRATPEAVHDAATPDDLVGTRLRDLDQRISAADKIATSEANDLQHIANSAIGRRASAANPSDNIDSLASRVARLAEADDRTARLSADATASVAAPGNVLTERLAGSRQTPRLADLIKLKRAEIERYEAEASTWLGAQTTNRLSQPLRHDGGHDQFSRPAPRPVAALHLNGAAHATSSPLMPANGYPPSIEPAAGNSLRDSFVPPAPPPAEPPRERTSAAIGARMTELREEGFSSSLYGFGTGLGIALMSGAALYVVLRLV